MRALCLVRETLGARLRPRRLRLRHAGARHRPDLAVRQRGAEAALPAAACAAATRSPPSRCPSPRPAPTSRRMRTTARRDGDSCVLDGAKTWISNGGIADTTSCSRAPARRRAPRACRPSSSMRTTPGLDGRRAHRRDRAASARHAAPSTAAACRPTDLLGEPGEGFRIALATLDVFRSTVGAAALGLRAPRARRGARARASARRRSASRSPSSSSPRPSSPTWRSRSTPRRCSSTAPPGPRMPARRASRARRAMAKLFATEAAQRVIDARRAALRRAAASSRRAGRAALPRDPRAAHLRGHDRDPEAGHHRAGRRWRTRHVEAAVAMSSSTRSRSTA